MLTSACRPGDHSVAENVKDRLLGGQTLRAADNASDAQNGLFAKAVQFAKTANGRMVLAGDLSERIASAHLVVTVFARFFLQSGVFAFKNDRRQFDLFLHECVICKIEIVVRV